MLVGYVDLPDTGSGPDDRPANTSEYSARVEVVDPQTVKVTRHATGTVAVSPQTGRGTQWNWLPKSLQGGAGTIVRGNALTRWLDNTVSTSDTGSDAPVFSYDALEWLGEHGDYATQWLAALLTNVRVDLQDLSIVPDPRLQLGDRVTVEVTTLGVELTAFVTSKKLARSDGALSMQVSLMITAATVNRATWAAVEAHWRNQSWSQLETDLSGDTYNTWEANPLG